MDLARLLATLQARWRLVAGVTLGVGAIALLLGLVATPLYTASTVLLLDVREPDLLSNQGATYSILAPTYVATQVDIVHSMRVSNKVIKALGIDKSESARLQWQDRREGAASFEQYYGDILGRFLTVIPSRTSNILTLEFTNPDPTFAANAANAFAKAYLEASVDLKVDPTKDYADWFAQRSAQERIRVEEAQAKLSEFQRENGIVATDERVDMETSRLAELSSQLTQVQAQLGESTSREKQARKPGSSPDVQHNGVVEGLRAEIARSEAKLEDMARQYGPNYPAYQRAQAELEALRNSLQEEMRKVASTVNSSNDVNIQREAQIRAALDAQKAKVLKVRGLRDQLTVLQREVDNAQKAFDLVGQRFSQTSLESQVQHTNVIVLSEAQVPTRPSSPKKMRNTAIGVAAGLVLGILLALVLEQRAPRVRLIGDVTSLLELPLLATISGPRGAANGIRRFFGKPAYPT